MKRSLVRLGLIVLLTGVILACNPYGPLNNLVDPNSSSYVGTPTVSSPIGAVASTNPTLMWQDATPGTSPAEYRVQVSTDSAFTNLVVNQTTTRSQYTVATALTEGTTYSWRVAAETGNGSRGSWSVAETFTIDVQTFTVSYNGNGATSGSVPIDSNSYPTGALVTVLANNGGLADSGYTFVGWNTQSDGNGTSYAGGTTFAMGTANVTLYAQWTALPTYTVTYYANGATGGSVPTDSNNYLTGSTVTVLGNTGSLTESGESFGGWNTQPDGSGTSYAPDATFSMGTANVSLYAEWTAATVTIWQDSNQHTWVENNYYKIDVSNGSEFEIKNPAPVDWRAYYPTSYNWNVALGNNCSNGYGTCGTWDVAGAGVNNLGLATISSTSTQATATFSQSLSTTYPVASPTFVINPTFTFYAAVPLIKISVPPVTNASSSPNPNAYDFGFTLTPGGTEDSDDYYYYPGMTSPQPYPYGSGVWPIYLSQMTTVGNGYVYFCAYDTSAQQGIAYIMPASETANFDSDENYGIASIGDMPSYGSYSHFDLRGNASESTTMYIYIFKPDTGSTPYKPVEDFITNQIGGY